MENRGEIWIVFSPAMSDGSFGALIGIEADNDG
jgi:hypothetical protein